MTPIKNIIFDFGGVLSDLDFQGCLEGLVGLGYPREKLTKEFVMTGVFQKMDLGTISTEEFWEELRRTSHRPDVGDEEWRAVWNSILLGIPKQRYEALRELRKGYRLFLLSNISDPHWEYTVQNLAQYGGECFLDWFERVFLSFQMHLEKPDTAIFKKVLEETGISAAETLFVDDRGDNIQGARRTGLVGLQAIGDEWIAPLVGKELYAEDFKNESH